MDKDHDGSEHDAKGGNSSTEMSVKKRDTPRSLCFYSRDELLEVRASPSAMRRPMCLSKEFNTVDGVWDPEKWSRSFDASGTASPLTFGDPRGKGRPADIDNSLMRRRLSDPKDRLKDERDCIVLSPQRRSFGTGCHVTTSSSINRQVSCPADFKEGNDRDRDRRDQRRIGSGRIQIDRERDQNRERDFRGVRDRFDNNDSRRFEAPASRFSRRDVDDRERRDFRDRTSYGTRRRDNYRRHSEEEPEWFSGGPSSQSDTIELRGFDTTSHDVDEEPDEHAVTSDKADEERNRNERAGSISVSDRNGSLETNESSSPENSPPSVHASHQTPSGNSLFDFNEFFKIENVIPGLIEPPVPGPEVDGAGSSRFSHWFSVAHSQGNSRNNSRRSSMNEEFGYLNEIIGGSKSPANPSPSQMYVKMRSGDKPGSPVAVMEALANQKAANNPVVDALLQKNAIFDQNAVASPGSTVNAKDAELQLKALLFGGRKDSTASSSNNSSTPGMSPLTLPGRVKTVTELEAGLRHQVTRNAAINSLLPLNSPQEKDEGDLTAFNKLLCLMTAGASGQESPKQNTPQPRSMSPLQQLTVGQMGAVQNDFVQALLKNREQQRLIQQQTLQHMRHQNPQHLQQLQIQQALLQQQLVASTSAGDQNLQQLQIQQALQQQQLATSTSAGDQNLQQLQQALLQQQMVGRPSAPPTPPNSAGGPDPILNFIKQNPTIVTKPPSPQIQSPQLPTMLHTSTPRVPSPAPPIAQQNLLQQQPPPSPRVPSPIMFSQQPPGHLSAPSPVHPNQMAMTAPSPNLGSNTLTTAPAMPRVPSPQELRVHTQCIMHNALIKKQLEDQKERFFRKQQERVKSPNPGCMNLSRPPPPIAPMTTVRTALPAAFTPTSVMRKMHSERAEKSKHDGLDGMQDALPLGPCKQLMRPEGLLEKDLSSTMEQYPDHFDPTILNGPPPPVERMPAPSSSGATPSINVNHMIANGMRSNLQSSVVGPSGVSGGVSSQQGVAGLAASIANPEQMSSGYGPPDPMSPKHAARAVFGQSMMQGNPVVSASPPMGPGPGRPIVKGVGGSLTTQSTNHLRPMMTSMHQGFVPNVDPSVGHRAIVGIPNASLDIGNQSQRLPARQLSVSPSPLAARAARVSPTPFPLTSCMPGQSTSVGIQHAATNAYILQQMLHGAISPSASPNVRCNLNALNQLAAYQAQQSRPMDPRVPPRGMYPPVIAPRPILPNTMGFGAPGAAALGHNISPQLQKTVLNSPNAMPPSQGMQFGGMNGNNNVKPGEANLMRWFGSDMLKKQLPSMPPLPTQGQKVMTLDELELC